MGNCPSTTDPAESVETQKILLEKNVRKCNNFVHDRNYYEVTPLLPLFEEEYSFNTHISSTATTSSTSALHTCQQGLLNILKVLEFILDLLPFMTVIWLQPIYSATNALGDGTLASGFVMFYLFLKKNILAHKKGVTLKLSKFQPKILDMGQFLLFGLLYVFGFLLQYVSKNSGIFLLLWFNALTTGYVTM